MSTNKEVKECPICMDCIESDVNVVVTECGHSFHCKCLMQNVAHNGYGCPYCRSKMAEEPEEEEEEDEEDEWSESTFIEEDYVLTTFRMFHQQLNGEVVEEEEEDDDITLTTEEERENSPDAVYITNYLIEKGVNMLDLVKNVLWLDEGEFGNIYTNYEDDVMDIYKHFKDSFVKYAREKEEKEQKEENKEKINTFVMYENKIGNTNSYFNTLPITYAKLNININYVNFTYKDLTNK
jgi:hypothetical protein